MSCSRATRLLFAVFTVLVVPSCATGRGPDHGSPIAVRGSPTPPTLGFTRPTVAGVQGVDNTVPNKWRQYFTAVNPGSSIQFVSSNYGWRLDGQSGTVDNSLASTAGLIDVDPGTSISASSDGGRTWSAILHVPDGIWGFDLLSPSAGFVVTVTGLESTLDGGSTWQSLSEPPSSLVIVSFGSDSAGVGITTAGKVFVTTDGARSWTASSLTVTASGVCFSNASAGYLSSSDGAIYRTVDAGATWIKERPNLLLSATPVIGTVSTALSCNPDGAWESQQWSAPGTHAIPYAITASNLSTGSWQLVASNVQSYASLVSIDPQVSTTTLSSLTAQFGALGSSNADTAQVLGFPNFGWAVSGFTLGSSGNKVARTMPSLGGQPAELVPTANPAVQSPVATYVRALGASTFGTSSWFYIRIQTPAPVNQVMVLGSSDSGQTWSVLSTSSLSA